MTELSPRDVAFVVIGRNEGERLEQCLRSLLRISKRIVYADSASTDGSSELAERLGAIVVRLPQDGKLTAARGRNAGYAELRRRFRDCLAVQFIDGDCVLQSDWIEKGLNFLADHPDAGVVFGRRFEAHPEASIYNRMCDREWDTPIGEARECGGDALIRCEAYDEVGGYRPELQAGEEPEMTARMRVAGWKVWRIDAVMTEHDAKILSLRQWWLRTQRGGFGFAQVWSKTKAQPDPLYAKQLRSALFWAILVPTLAISLAVLTGERVIILAAPLLYGVQLSRVALGRRGGARWTSAALIMLAKFPEAIGALRFVIGGASRVREYKAG